MGGAGRLYFSQERKCNMAGPEGVIVQEDVEHIKCPHCGQRNQSALFRSTPWGKYECPAPDCGGLVSLPSKKKKPDKVGPGKKTSDSKAQVKPVGGAFKRLPGAK